VGADGSDGRLFLEAVFWIARTGSPWRDLPPRFGKWNTVFKRFRDWVLVVQKRLGRRFDLQGAAVIGGC